MVTAARKKLNVAILGSGNIGTDLLVKITQSPLLHCVMFAGRNLNSSGMKKAISLGVPISDRGIDAIIEHAAEIDMVFDATSAAAHEQHWPELEKRGKIVFDMTPAKLGDMCVPAINSEDCLQGVQNVNMITCGGQSAIPIAYALSRVHADIDYIEVASNIASRSAGPATRYNLDEYIGTTEEALARFTGVKNTKAILILNPAHPPIDMQTTIYARIKNPDMAALTESVKDMVDNLKTYVPGYQLVTPPILQDGRVITTIKVQGRGDYLPAYAGNLDIINCAAIAVAERMAANILNTNEASYVRKN